MRFFDTARVYTDSEAKLGEAFADIFAERRDSIYIATKAKKTDPDGVRQELETSLKTLGADYIDIYQFHNAQKCYRPGDGTGMYEVMLEAKEQGLIKHIGITTHRVNIAEEAVGSGLYETLQYPFSYLASERELKLVEDCSKADMGFIAMKGLAGGMLNNPKACMAFMSRFDNVLPIWGIQRESELEEWLAFFEKDAVSDDEVEAVIAKDRAELSGEFCRSCGYCAPCTVGIKIFNCARMSQLIRRSPSASYLSEEWQKEMLKIEECVDCGMCKTRCPYQLDIPALLRKNLADYKEILKSGGALVR